MRFFNTEGPVNCADHYYLPPCPGSTWTMCWR